MRHFFTRFYWFIAQQLGLDFRRFCQAVSGLPAYFRDLQCFRDKYKGSLLLKPCLLDRFGEGGTTHSEYFWQDLLVARWVFEASPIRHLDVGSRIDGFVAHVAAFRDLDVLDIRRITTAIPRVNFVQANIMDTDAVADLLSSPTAPYDSVSCLHVLEHLGLGRYGDPIDPDGYLVGFSNICQLLRERGSLYLSTPVGDERVEFNANWVFSPQTILSIADKSSMRLVRLASIDPLRGIVSVVTEDPSRALLALESQSYCLAVMEFRRMLSASDRCLLA